ncbi:hypothetical protein [Streptomyces sp. WAC08241]|uniref:hypothetical protein n=1 Tax=Streptomyces sp. WAC08241 TaxID=2487421 RepID=UPI000F76629C|nr:hypothetical protein [Streptomyces sp. WAC08241]RSS32277.1 hypothetical protein EF906_34195 [Streptomyces sp. WAC08241]
MATTYVATLADRPIAAADTLDAVQNDAVSAETEWAGDRYDYRWDEYQPGEVWRLMQRAKGPAGKGRRFSWTGRAVHAVEHLTA